MPYQQYDQATDSYLIGVNWETVRKVSKEPLP